MKKVIDVTIKIILMLGIILIYTKLPSILAEKISYYRLMKRHIK